MDVNTDNANCGTCGNACTDGEVCAGGTCGTTCGPDLTRCTASDGTDHCKDTTHDPANCGSCGHACTAPDNATAACAGNRCAYFCADGFADCNVSAADGCETDIAGDPANCGACGHVCPAGPGQVATCSAGVCGVACDASHADCNADPSDGCEVDISTDVGNCGACANACPSDATDTATCAGGHCGIQCLTGHGDCNNDPTDGCENTLDSPADCGACGASCPAVTNAAPTCTAPAQCGFACDPGYADCNTDPSDGCEVDTQTDVNNCGTCGNACPVGFAATGATCNGGTCAAVCNPGGNYIDCDGKASTGCEVDSWGDNANCGTCGTVCAGTTSCLQGTCSAFGALDQSVPPNPSSTTREGIPATHFQTYVAGKTGHLGGVAFWGGLGGCGTFKLDVWAGAGVPSSGAPIYTGAAVKACGSTPGIFKVDRNAWVVPQTAGQTYTLRFTRVSGEHGRRLRQPVPERLQRRRPPVPGDRAHGPRLRDLGVLAAAPRRHRGENLGTLRAHMSRTRATRGRAAIPDPCQETECVADWPAYAVAIRSPAPRDRTPLNPHHRRPERCTRYATFLSAPFCPCDSLRAVVVPAARTAAPRSRTTARAPRRCVGALAWTRAPTRRTAAPAATPAPTARSAPTANAAPPAAPDLNRCTATDGTDHCRDTAVDPANCGACGNACTAPANADPRLRQRPVRLPLRRRLRRL